MLKMELTTCSLSGCVGARREEPDSLLPGGTETQMRDVCPERHSFCLSAGGGDRPSFAVVVLPWSGTVYGCVGFEGFEPGGGETS